MPEKTTKTNGRRKRKKLPDWSDISPVDPKVAWERIDALKTEAGGGFIGSSHKIAATMNRERIKLERQLKPWSHHSVQEFYYRAKKQNGWGSNGKGTAVAKKARRKAVTKKTIRRTSMKFAKILSPAQAYKKLKRLRAEGYEWAGIAKIANARGTRFRTTRSKNPGDEWTEASIKSFFYSSRRKRKSTAKAKRKTSKRRASRRASTLKPSQDIIHISTEKYPASEEKTVFFGDLVVLLRWTPDSGVLSVKGLHPKTEKEISGTIRFTHRMGHSDAPDGVEVE